MKYLPKFLFMAFLTLFMLSSCSVDDIEDDPVEINIVSTETKTIEIEILSLINAHRLEMGLNALEKMDLVKSVAFSHSDYMVSQNEVSHDNFFSRSDYLKEKAKAMQVSENVAYGYNSAEGVVNAWLNSTEHKANLEGDYTNFDVSAVKCDETGRWYYTNIFIRK